VKKLVVFALVLMLNAKCAMAQSGQTAPAAPTAAATPSSDADLTIHYKGPGVTAPVLEGVSGNFDPVTPCKKLDGKVTLLIAVDRSGTARLVLDLDWEDPDLYLMAQRVMLLDSFKPGTVDGAPALVGVVDRMKLETCRIEERGVRGTTRNSLQLRSMPEQTLELVDAPKGALTSLQPLPSMSMFMSISGSSHTEKNGVTAPVVIHTGVPQFSDEARKAKYQGVCLISLMVDETGVPRNPRVVRPVGMGLDEKALESVKQYRFKPAMKDGKTPVPVMITVEINFRLY
jgi:TonB family protein